MSEQVDDTQTAPDAASCSYVRSDGSRCPGEIVDTETNLCFWHDRDSPKDGPQVRVQLEEWAESGCSMEGFELRYASLEGLKLSNKPNRDLRKANLFRASLQGASLFNVDLRGAELMKANLAGANMNEANMQDVNLLGATLDATRLEHVEWSDLCLNERQALEALRAGDEEGALQKLKEAQEVYRALRRAYGAQSEPIQAGVFFRREMIMRRWQMPRWSGGRLWSWIVDASCAYGESPPRVIVSSLVLNIVCAVGYFFAGINGPEGLAVFDPGAGLKANVVAFFECVYYSVVTFTTLGYSDEARQIWIVRPLASAQAFIGAFMMALFVVTFGKRMTRS